MMLMFSRTTGAASPASKRDFHVTDILIEQVLNGLQFGIMLFLMAAGLTLIFGVMGLINLAHGSLYMIGAFCAAAAVARRRRFLPACAGGRRLPPRLPLPGRWSSLLVIRRLYDKDHLDQVLATFALILIFSEGTRWVFGSFPLFLDVPAISCPARSRLPGGIEYPLYRLTLIVTSGLAGGIRSIIC